MNKEKSRGASLIVESAIVFPITFVVVILLLMLGDVYLTYSRIERMLVESTIELVASCENPMMEYVLVNNDIPKNASQRDVKIYPYRYIFTGNINKICDNYERAMEKKIRSMKSYAFKSVKPTLKEVNITPRLYIIYSEVQTDCDFYFKMPINLPFSNKPLISNYHISFIRSIGDSAEFVRNVGMINDVLERNEQVQDFAKKISEAMNKIAKWLN